MTHEEAAPLVPDLGRGRLAPTEEAAVRAHLAECKDCSGLTHAYRVVSTAMRVATEHPDPAELVAHVMGTTRRPGVEQHLAACSSCLRQAAAIRAAESELGTRRIPVRAWSAWAAAAAVPLLIGYIGWIQLRVLPGMREAVARTEEGGSVSPETVALPLFSPATRGGDEGIVVPVGVDQRSIAVAVAPALPRDMADAEVLRIDVRERNGVVVYSSEITAGEIRRLSGKSGAFALVLPASALPTGDAWLSIHAASRGELLAVPFQVRRD